MPGHRYTPSRRPRGGGNRYGLPVPVQPTVRNSGVKPRSVVCPDCAAEVDAPCTSATGTPRGNVHASRKRMATRAWWDEREAGQAEGLVFRWHRDGWGAFTARRGDIVLDVRNVGARRWEAMVTQDHREVWRGEAQGANEAKALAVEAAAPLG